MGWDRRQKHTKNKLPPFVPLLIATLDSAAWRTMSHGARSLYIALKRRYTLERQKIQTRKNRIPCRKSSTVCAGNGAHHRVGNGAHQTEQACRKWRTYSGARCAGNGAHN